MIWFSEEICSWHGCKTICSDILNWQLEIKEFEVGVETWIPVFGRTDLRNKEINNGNITNREAITDRIQNVVLALCMCQKKCSISFLGD